ncbi:hypothetical protein Nepgr_026285 [Nepenthes gracilis]|uniref:NAC domain-containing protein n=1 Tax=Nepenthes gracilis TaxID=150966 RepID=A0AAD3T807_NEPGR|nr:hypothetical protein Nepgr_026285 [Nepenthes gracilis]
MAIASIMNLNYDNANTYISGNDDDNNNNKQQQQKQQQDEHDHDMVMPGFRFHPTEEELVEFYLRRKVEGKKFNVELITFLDLYRYDPWELPALAAIGEKEWFFYVPRDRKYRNGDRPNRVTTSGYWKATGADRMIRAENFRPIGLKKTLVFYSGKAPKGVRSSWIMNEYRLPQHETKRYEKVEISLCRVYKRAGVEDSSSVPRELSSKPSSRGLASSSSDKKHQNQQQPKSFAVAIGEQMDQIEKIRTASETDGSSSTEVGTALGLSHNNNSNLTHQQLVSPLLEMDKMILLGKEDAAVSTPPLTRPILGNCTTFFMGSSSSPPCNLPSFMDDLHRMVTYQQACMINQQHLFQSTLSHANNSPQLYSNLVSPQSAQSGLNSTAMPGSALAPAAATFPDRLWDWNLEPEHNRDFNSPFK